MLRPEVEAENEATYWESLDQMLARMDIVSVNCPHTPATFHLLSARRLKLMKKDAYLVNTARGEVIDENALSRLIEGRGWTHQIGVGEAAFYGPKISVQVKDALGRNWQMSTIQLDFNMPDRFELEYTAPDGTRQRPVLIHRALFGSIERFIGVLTEHYAGAFPAWLAPVQVVGIPVADGHVAYLEEVTAQLRSAGIRAEVDASDDRMAKKIVNQTNLKVPFMLLAGDRDVEAGAVSFRFGDRTQINGVPRDAAVAAIAEWIGQRQNATPTAELMEVSSA